MTFYMYYKCNGHGVCRTTGDTNVISTVVVCHRSHQCNRLRSPVWVPDAL